MKLQTVAMDLLLMTKICVPRHTGFCLFVCLFECCCSVSHVFQCNKGTNTLIAEALLNIEQEKLDYITQKNAGDSHEFHNEDVKFFFQCLLPHVAKIPPKRNLLFRCEVQGEVQQLTYETPQNYSTQTNTPCPQFTQFENVKLPPSSGTVMAVAVQYETEVTSYNDQ